MFEKFEQELTKRGVPFPVLKGLSLSEWESKRAEIKDLLCETVYGYFPPLPLKTEYKTLKQEPRFYGGKVIYETIEIKLTLARGTFTFPLRFIYPKNKKSLPAVVSLNFEPGIPNKYLPVEEMCDNGFAVAAICYNEITTDDNDFTNGLAGILYKDGKRGKTDAGKIDIWAYAAMRVMDYLQSIDFVDKKNIAVAGHSRLGKTALVTAAFDARFAIAYSNDSGCSGAAITRDKAGENIEVISTAFPFWFCENYQSYKGKEHELPLEQNFLLSAIAPRKIYVASASLDTWADPVSEFLCCVAASKTYKHLGLTGFICDKQDYPEIEDAFQDGNIGYHLREGEHFVTRHDWNLFFSYFRKHLN